MGWSIGYDENWQRNIGYGVPAICDHPKCNEEIDRGLSHVCGDEPYGGEVGCGLYFCSKHLSGLRKWKSVCARCERYRKPFKPKPDTLEWINHKLTDESWQQWRDENPQIVTDLTQRIEAKRKAA
ncbi:MAG: hypothetical protein ACRDAM_15870 [Casimicrobium sp.]